MAAQRISSVSTRKGARSARSAQALLVLTETGPVLVVTNYPDIRDGRLMEVLRRRGITKFIAYSVPIEHVRQVYGMPFEVISTELKRVEAARVLDYDGTRIFEKLTVGELKHSYTCET